MTDGTIELADFLTDLRVALHRRRSRRRRRGTLAVAVAAAGAAASVALGATYGGWWGGASFGPPPNPIVLPALVGADVLTGARLDPAVSPGHAGFLVVWQSYCSPCQGALTDAQAFAAAHPDVPVVGLDVEDLSSVAARDLDRLGVRFPSIPADNATIGALGVAGYPTVFAFDSSGRIVAEVEGPMSAGALEDEFARLG